MAARAGKTRLATFHKERAKASVNDVFIKPHSSASETTYGQSPLKENVSEGKEEIKDNLGEEPDVVLRMDEKKKREIDELIDAPKQDYEIIKLYKVTEKESERILKDTGINVSGFEHVIDKEGINHILKGHWEGTEKRKDQIPIKNEDFYLIPEIIGKANRISKERTKKDCKSFNTLKE